SDTIPTPTLPLKEREEAWRGAAGVGRCAGRSCVRSALAGGRGGGRGHLLVGLGGGRYGGVDDFLDLADALQRRRGLGLELGQRGARQRLGRRHGVLQWVAVHAVDAEFVVLVRAGGQPGGADVADHL